jgi:hypothetical protein
MPLGILEEIAGGLGLCPDPLVLSAGPLALVDAWYRRIDFDFPPITEWVFAESVDPLPLCRNEYASRDIGEIVLCLDTPEDPLVVPEFRGRDVEPLAAFEAPPDIDADMAGLANDLLNLILKTDVLPFMPVCEDVHGDEFDFLFEGIFSQAVITERGYRNVVPDLRVERIEAFSGPVPDVPRLVRAGDVVDDLLWEFVLPELPVRRTLIDEYLASAVDDLELNTDTDFSSEEPLPDEVARLCRIYRPAARQIVLDD